jgi:hypothetical protein
MPLPKKSIKKNIPLTFPKTLYPRREELLEKINKDGTYLPKSILHADLDGGFLDFVKNDLKTVVDGKVIPMIDILITTQNWSQFTESWNFQNIDRNVEPPFITVVRVPEVKFGTNPALLYNIPNRRQYFYAQVPTWDGQRHGADVYKIPQPVPIDISFQVKIVCNRMRELNQFNKNVIEMFASRQAYSVIKGHYIPIVMGNISDESVMDIGKRKYYVQSYEFTMLGFLIDENEFEVSPAVSRILQVVEFETTTRLKEKKIIIDNKRVEMDILFVVGNDTITEVFEYTTDATLSGVENVDTYDVYINNDFYGSDIEEIQINTNDVVRIVVTKQDVNQESKIKLINLLL